GAGYLFDERDAINRRNFISYGLTSRLLGRAAAPPPAPAPAPAEAEAAAEAAAPIISSLEAMTVPQGLPGGALAPFVGPPAPPAAAAPGQPAAPPPKTAPRELARVSILHGYDISRTLVGDSHASDVDLGLRLTPLDWLGFSSNTSISPQDSTLRGITVGAIAREPRWTPADPLHNFLAPTSLGISYRFVEKNVNQSPAPQGPPEALLFQPPGVSEVDGSVFFRLSPYLGLTFLSRYSFNDSPVVNSQGVAVPGESTGPHFLERDYLVRLVSRCNCWVLDAGVADKFNPDERLFRIQFTLIGLGSFGESPFNRNFVGFAPLAPLGASGPGFGRSGLY